MSGEKSLLTKLVIAFAAILLTAAHSSASLVTIYYHDFSGPSDQVLHGQTPVTGPQGVTWEASTDVDVPYMADGSFASASHGRIGYLPFTPESGYVYTLDGRLGGLNVDDTRHSPYHSFGFLHATDPEGEYWFDNPPLIWHRYNNYSQQMGNLGVIDNAWGGGAEDYSQMINSEAMDFRIVLDTMGAEWTATWFAKAHDDAEYLEVVSARALDMDDTAAHINAIGFGHWAFQSGQWESLTLTQIPEPSTALVAGLAALFGLCFYRPRRK